MALARSRIVGYHETRRSRAKQWTSTWVMLGGVMLLVGITQIASAVI